MRKYVVLLGIALSLCIGALVATQIYWNRQRASFYGNALPKVIQTTGFIAIGSDSSLLDMLLPIRAESCGGVIFKLSAATISSLKEQGLLFLASARQGRGYPAGDRLSHYYHYAEWQETPVPTGWLGDGILAMELHCMDIGHSTRRAIGEAVQAPGSYFTTKDEGQLLILPDLGWAVYVYYG
ncbi:MAG: hypothetical protein WBA15_15785 [Mesorhizobium sp.]